jgi:hypothetical protein
MCDLAFVNLLRERVRHQEAEDQRSVAFGKSPCQRFVPWIMPSQASLQPASEDAGKPGIGGEHGHPKNCRAIAHEEGEERCLRSIAVTIVS